VWHWLSTAFSTYVLHTEHGNGYQWWSGPAIVGGLAWNGVVQARKHNCYEHRCPFIGRFLGADGHHRCKRHHTAHLASLPAD
jgi:hypothetical protein